MPIAGIDPGLRRDDKGSQPIFLALVRPPGAG
jgi:hypothetical protein